jgi:hypothetical protein
LAPTGVPIWTVTGAVGSCTSNTGPVTSGVTAIYTCVVPVNSSGSYAASVSYPGDNNYFSAGPSADGVNISKVIPSVFVSTSTATTSLGSSFTFSATVTGPNGGQTPTGTATWTITGISGISCASTTGPTGITSSVIYTCLVNAKVAGTYLPLFTYNADGDANYLPTSPQSGASTIVGTATPNISVVANASSATLGSTITFTATVSGPTGAVAPSPIGQWAITNVPGVTTCALTTGPSQTLNVSTYTCSVVASLVGTYSASFIFTGDNSYNVVLLTKSLTSTTVAQATPSVTLAGAPLAPTLGGSETISATVTGPTGSAAPTGNITWALLELLEH